MKLSVLASVDLLVVGGTSGAVRLAVDERKKGKRVFIVTGYTYFGEDLCAGLKLENGKTPMTVKRELDREVIGAGIEFLFRTWPVKLFPNGLAVGNAEGMGFIQAGAVVDFTEYFTAARMSRMPFSPINPGSKPFVFRFLEEGGTSDDISFNQVNYHLKTVSGTVNLADSSISSLARALLDARLQGWSNRAALSADFAEVDFGSRPLGEDPEGFVFLPEQYVPFSALLKDRPLTEMELGDLPELKSFDTVVVGGGTAGAPAGIASGRFGVRALVLEELAHLGGLGTEGRISAYWFGLLTGFTGEVDRRVDALRAPGKPPQKAHTWEVECKQTFWDSETLASGTEVWHSYTCCGCRFENGRIRSVIVAGPFGAGSVSAKEFIDCTGNANLAAFCGMKTVFSSSDEPAVQGAGMSPVNPGKDLYNTDYMFTVDSSNRDTSRAFVTGRDRNANQFDLARIAGTRERRRIVGDLVLQPTDFFKDRCYSDTVCMASSNFDTHGFTVHPLLLFQPTGHDPKTVKIPLRALLSPGVPNLQTTGLGVSAHRDAMPLIRMQADVQNQGFAAGVIAAYSVKNHCDIRALDIRSVQTVLAEEGIVPRSVLTEIDSDPVSPDANASIFAAPDFAELTADFHRSPDFEKAVRLALLGNGAGLGGIRSTLSGAEDWDAGWNYRGMGQFGMSSSRFDVAILALARISTDDSCFRRLAEKLVPESEFSHFRACCYFWMKHPSPSAASVLENLLGKFECHAVSGWENLLNSPFAAETEVSERNFQLKELYLAGALRACAPNHPLAIRFLNEYRSGIHEFYAIFARKFLA